MWQKTCIQEEFYTDFTVTLLTQQVMDYMTGSALTGVHTTVCKYYENNTGTLCIMQAMQNL